MNVTQQLSLCIFDKIENSTFIYPFNITQLLAWWATVQPAPTSTATPVSLFK